MRNDSALELVGGRAATFGAENGTGREGFSFPTVNPEHRHARALLENAMRYVDAGSRTSDPISGYPYEGWNDEPGRGLCLRCYTQLTAIGKWIEVLANVVAGYADTPHLSREQALERLNLAVRTLRQDQKDPQVSAKGLLGNFLDLASGRRLGPLAGEVNRQVFVDAFGQEKGEAIWQALAAKGWIIPMANGREAAIQRGTNYGSAFFDGILAPYRDEVTREKIMAALDRRIVTVVFGDNANLSSSIAKAIGALLVPSIRDNPRIEELRGELEQFLEDQQPGYAHLYDAQVGLFSFGWDATADRRLGWEDGQGNWQTGYMDYLVNEFRGPASFVAMRYGLPVDSLRNLGFKMKPYQKQDGARTYVLAPWEGSAFQALGLGLSMSELEEPSWRRILESTVDVQIDYAARKQLPGFLSESYIGDGAKYTGNVGIPDIAVSTAPRITDVASLYTVGVAYSIAPAKIEQFLSANWSTVSKLMTDHGPWEGFHAGKQEPIQIQTTAHTLSLVLGMLGTGSQNMKLYLQSKGLHDRLARIHKPGQPVDLLSGDTQVFAWSDEPSTLKSAREEGNFRVQGERVRRLGIALAAGNDKGADLSGGLLSIGYRSTRPLEGALIAFKPTGTADAHWIPKELLVQFTPTIGREETIEVPLPATPGLSQIKEVVITWEGRQTEPLDFSLTRFAFAPLDK